MSKQMSEDIWKNVGIIPHLQRDKMSNTEMRYTDAGTTAVAFASQLSYYLAKPAQGTDVYQRTGRTIRIESVKLDVFCSIPGVGTTTANTAYTLGRVILFYDKKGNTGTVTPLANILGEARVTPITADEWSFQNMANEKTIKIIKDITVAYPPWSINSGALVSAGYLPDRIGASFKMHFDIDLKKLNLVTKFDASGNPLTDVLQVYIGSATNTGIVFYKSKVFFTN